MQPFELCVCSVSAFPSRAVRSVSRRGTGFHSGPTSRARGRASPNTPGAARVNYFLSRVLRAETRVHQDNQASYSSCLSLPRRIYTPIQSNPPQLQYSSPVDTYPQPLQCSEKVRAALRTQNGPTSAPPPTPPAPSATPTSSASTPLPPPPRSPSTNSSNGPLTGCAVRISPGHLLPTPLQQLTRSIHHSPRRD